MVESTSTSKTFLSEIFNRFRKGNGNESFAFHFYQKEEQTITEPGLSHFFISISNGCFIKEQFPSFLLKKGG